MLGKNEDRVTPKEVYNFKIWVMATIAAFGSLMIGYDSSFVGGALALPSFTHEFGKLNPTTSANLVSTYQAGAFFGAFCGYPLGYFLGRKWGIAVCGFVFTVGSIIMVIANSSTGLGPIYGGRAIAGLAIGAASNLAPTYISEIAPSAIRGALVGMWEVGWQVGGICGFWVNYGVKQHESDTGSAQWLIPFGLQLVPGAMLFIGSFFLIESPRWLLTRDRRDDASRNLCKLRNLDPSHPYVMDEMALFEETLARERREVGRTFWGPIKFAFTSRTMLKRLALASSMFIVQNASGINSINYYSPTIFRAIGITGTSTALLTTGVFGVIKTLGAIIWIAILIERLGRRKIMMFGAAGCSAFMIWIGVYVAVAANRAPVAGATLSAGGRSAVAAFYLWTIVYGSTLNGTPWVIGAEIFPQSSRPVGMAIVAASNWLYNLAISLGTPHAFAWSRFGLFLIFAGLSAIAVPYIYFVLPETAGVPLDRMSDLFSSKNGPIRHRHGKVMAMARAEHDGTANNGHVLPHAGSEGDSTPEKRSTDLETGDAALSK
ncbi:putative quinate permease [Tilletiopsis washingtonensis]|jgi:sugar porter (SP) family MFS transporter|uniref:Quinate transporter n=1 Tax=Tilletiopsis washingtonensis TaxID=58919 RepID=A0A316ZIB5_9BASI|nr:putative quinate permease [Tilletiopsis washingtonensis]PWO00755.1 putative quinate permease [Tilletiopsis washingtonensis]